MRVMDYDLLNETVTHESALMYTNELINKRREEKALPYSRKSTNKCRRHDGIR